MFKVISSILFVCYYYYYYLRKVGCYIFILFHERENIFHIFCSHYIRMDASDWVKGDNEGNIKSMAEFRL